MERKQHAWIPELEEQLRQGKMSRREFIRFATLLGTSLAGATAMAACAPVQVQAPPTQAPAAPATSAPATAAAPASGIQRGGTVRVATYGLGRVDHPARYSWVSHSQSTRQVAEYLTWTNPDNITQPLLLEKWEASDDLKTWTLYARRGVKWNNGDDFTADDIVFTMKDWLDPEIGSSMLGLMSYLSPEGIEKVDDYTVRLHLDSAQLGVPEHLYHYPAQVMNHRTFEGDFLKAPVGTGPYTIAEYSEGERVVLKRRQDVPYWRMGEDNQPLPYLDEVIYIDMGEERAAHVAALQAGQVEVVSESLLEGYLAVRDDPNINAIAAPNASVNVVRMRVDMEPWTDVRIRQALKLCQDREKTLKLAYQDVGVVGQDHHVAPVHPEFCDIGTPEYDPERSRALLAQAGYPDGIDVEATIATEWMAHAEVLKADAEAGGFRINIKSVPVGTYWDMWTEVPFGITNWSHRPLGTMVLSLAYIADAEGKPVPWNETRWVDEEFSSLLRDAEATYDIEERRKIMCELEKVQQERGSVGIACFMASYFLSSKKLQDYQANPNPYDYFTEVWLKQA